MKIALAIEKYQPRAGGNERSTEQIARRLVERGHGVTVLANATDRTERREGNGELLPGGRVEALGGWSTATAIGLQRYVSWVRRRFDRGEFDLTMSVTPAVAADVVQPRGGTVRETLDRNLAMRSTAWKRSTKKLALALSAKQWALLAAERRTFFSPRTRKIVAISRYVADQLFHHHTIPSRRIGLIPNAAEIEEADPQRREMVRRRMRAALELTPDDVVFFFAFGGRRLDFDGRAVDFEDGGPFAADGDDGEAHFFGRDFDCRDFGAESHGFFTAPRLLVLVLLPGGLYGYRG